MAQQESAPTKDTAPKTPPDPKPCGDDFQPKTELDGKNDSGPEPEVHGREIPPQ
jgi:hypothetical protein